MENIVKRKTKLEIELEKAKKRFNCDRDNEEE